METKWKYRKRWWGHGRGKEVLKKRSCGDRVAVRRECGEGTVEIGWR